MTINTTGILSNSIRTQYVGEYISGAMFARIYDMLSSPIGMPMSELIKGSAVQVNFLSDLAPSTTVISQTADITPTPFRDATATVTPTSRADAIQDSELLLIQNYLNYSRNQGLKYEKVGKQFMESVDLLANAQATQGGFIRRAAARASLDAGTPGHRLVDSEFARAQSMFETLKVPDFLDTEGREAMPPYVCITHPFAYHDLRTSGLIDDIAIYQQAGIVFNHELGKLGPFSLIVTPWAKVFWGAGADNASAVATTLNGAVNALDTSIVVASATNVTAGQALNIGTEETGDTHYETNERVWVDADYVSGTTVNIIGEGDNGGLRFDHASGAAVRNADSAYTAVFGGPESLAKVFATDYLGEEGVEQSMGEFGTLVGPKSDGKVNQFATLGWKFYGGYGRISESRILRMEVSSSFEA